MRERIMQVFYGTDRLPYKDTAREVHYPIISSTSGGNLIIGENNTTKILFYVGLIGGNQAQWIANIKKPDGSLMYQLCSNPHSEGDDYVVELDISSLYTSITGDVYISIQGYSGETVIVEEDGTYSISGNPIVLSTGTIKVIVNYAPNVLPKGETLSPTVEQQILAALGEKLNIVDGIVSKQLLPNYVDYEVGQIVYVKNASTQALYQRTQSGWDKIFDFVEIDTKIITNVVVSSAKTGTGNIFQLSFINGNGQTLFVKSISLTGATETDAGLVNTYAQSWKGVKSFADLPQTKEGRVYNNDRQMTDKGYVDNAIDDMKEVIDQEIEEIEGDYYGVTQRVETIEGKIPSQATTSNQLADKDFVNSTVNSLAAFYITKNAQGDPFETKAELQSATTFYSGGQVRVPTRNDYCLVRADETHDDASCRYIYQGNQWEFQFVVNETPLTQAQVQAINSGITASLVSQITTNKNDITNLDENKVGLVEATQKFQSKIVSVDISISPSDWDDSKHFQSENVFGTLGFVNTDDTFYFVGISTEDDAYINTFRLDVVDVSSSDDEHTYISFSCGEIPTETINIRIGLIKKNAILGDMVGYLNIADLDGVTIEYRNGKVRVIASGVQVDATQVDVTTTHTSVQANIIRIDGEINRVEEKIPDAPGTDGNYTLKCSVADGVKTYSWVLDE